MLMPFMALALCLTSVSANDLVARKLQERSAIIANASTPADKAAGNLGTVAYFLNIPQEQIQTDLGALEALASADVAGNSWSGFYWPNYVGGLGYRFRDENFPKGKWSRSLEYVTRRPSPTISNDLLSPSEKYDTVMGVLPEEAGSLTAHQWNLGREEFRRTRKVATWQGICNGWAAASILLPLPQHDVVVPSARGPVSFTAEDLKALGSLLYANGKFESVFAGLRCYTDEAESEGGFLGTRVTTPECFDVNPAEWHLLVTHELGINKRPFIIDYIHDSEVWNKPVISYQLEYFDLKENSKTSPTFREVLRPSKKVMRYRRYRHPQTVNVVGVKMTTTLLFGISEDETINETKTVVYEYALELDEFNRILGGEWYSKNHPDFAWKPRFAGLPQSDGDALTPAELPLSRIGALAANKHGSPLPAFVRYLFENSTGQTIR